MEKKLGSFNFIVERKNREESMEEEEITDLLTDVTYFLDQKGYYVYGGCQLQTDDEINKSLHITPDEEIKTR
jgi:hypothetical protein